MVRARICLGHDLSAKFGGTREREKLCTGNRLAMKSITVLKFNLRALAISSKIILVQVEVLNTIKHVTALSAVAWNDV